MVLNIVPGPGKLPKEPLHSHGLFWSRQVTGMGFEGTCLLGRILSCQERERERESLSCLSGPPSPVLGVLASGFREWEVLPSWES